MRRRLTESEYREFLSFLFESDIRPRLTRVRNRHRHHFEDEFFYHPRTKPFSKPIEFILGLASC